MNKKISERYDKIMTEKTADLLGEQTYGDASIRVTLDFGHRKFMRLMGFRGVTLDGKDLRENSKKGIEYLRKKGLIEVNPLIGGGERCFYRATGLGEQVLRAMGVSP